MAASRLEFRILGSARGAGGRSSVPVGGPKQRALLALLLLSANRVVSRERLIAELFSEQSVRTRPTTRCATRSRGCGRCSALAAGDEPRLVARAPGYLLRVEPGELDLERFERLVAEARESLAAGDLTPGGGLAAGGRAPVGGAAARRSRVRAVRARRGRAPRGASARRGRGADRRRARARSALGARLRARGARAPSTRSASAFAAQLMLALYRCGRQAEGLEVYRQTRKRLNDELGLEPGVELQQLERAILVQDPALTGLRRTGHAGRRRGATSARSRASRRSRPRTRSSSSAASGSSTSSWHDSRTRRCSRSSARPGSGKSSLMRAGSAAGARALGSGCSCAPASGRPAELVARLERVAAGRAARRRRRPVRGVVRAVGRREPSAARSSTRSSRPPWDPERRAVVLLALRADFFGRLAPYVELADLLGPNHVLLGPMSCGRASSRDRGAGRAGWTRRSSRRSSTRSSTTSPESPVGCRCSRRRLLDLWLDRQGRRTDARRATSGRAAFAVPSAVTPRRRFCRSTSTIESSRGRSCCGSSPRKTARR